MILPQSVATYLSTLLPIYYKLRIPTCDYCLDLYVLITSNVLVHLMNHKPCNDISIILNLATSYP